MAERKLSDVGTRHPFKPMALSALCMGLAWCAATTPTAAYADNKKNAPCRAVQWSRLNLTDQQKSKLNNLDEEWQGTMSEVWPRLQENRKRKKELMRAPKPNEQAIMQLEQQIHEDSKHLHMEATHLYLNKRNTLSDDQKRQLRKMMGDED